jgi:hypothetical protein
MHVRPRDLRARLHTPRSLGVLLLGLGLLVYVNVVALADSAETAFRAVTFGQQADLASLVAAHQAELLRDAVLEYASLLAAVAGGVLVVIGPALQRARRRPEPASLPSPSSTTA